MEAVQKYQQYKPDGVLMDITMPDMDGIETLKKLVAMDASARVAMVTAMGQQSLVIEALKSGAKDFVVKPFNADRVMRLSENYRLKLFKTGVAGRKMVENIRVLIVDDSAFARWL